MNTPYGSYGVMARQRCGAHGLDKAVDGAGAQGPVEGGVVRPRGTAAIRWGEQAGGVEQRSKVARRFRHYCAMAQAEPDGHAEGGFGGWGVRGCHLVGDRPARTRAPDPMTTGNPESGDRWSGRRDSNSRPPEPHSGALPGCATPRWQESSSGAQARSAGRKSRASLAQGAAELTVAAPDGQGERRGSIISRKLGPRGVSARRIP